MPSISERAEEEQQEKEAKDFEILEGHTEAEVVIDEVDAGRIAENVWILGETSNEVEKMKLAERRKEIPKYRVEQQNLRRQPSEPTWCDGCAEGKVKRTAATRVVEEKCTDEAEDEAPKEEIWGKRIYVDLSGRAKPAFGKKVCALHQKGKETEYAGVEGLVNKEPETVRDAFNEHNAGYLKQIEACGSDNGPEFDGCFHKNLVDNDIRHPRSVPHRA